MLFNSIQFLIFFPVVTTLYFLTPGPWRWLLLLVASCIFYMAWIPAYILILAFIIVVDYFAAIQIGKAEGPKRKAFLGLSIACNIGVLALFKYYNFFVDNVTTLFHAIGLHSAIPLLSLILPIGLSFHTFQALSYTIEVYLGRQEPERHFGIYALYVMFYPQLVAGPIERPQNLLHQFHSVHPFNYDNVTNGLKLMLWGLFKKVVIADRLAILVNQVFNHSHDYAGWPLLLAVYCFSFQIFCDFSGYSDMALGAAQVMGYRLMTNFNRPYLSRSVAEFWTRWHISLSTWFRDYVYIPLGGNRVPKGRWYRNLSIVFLLSGLWHGASWTFVIWGGLHAVFMVLSDISKKWRATLFKTIGLDRFPALLNVLCVVFTFNCVSLAWIFFRAGSLPDAWYICTHLFGQQSMSNQDIGLNRFDLIVALAAVTLMESIHLLQERYSIRQLLNRYPTWVRWSAYYAALIGTVIFAKFNSQPFIYFQF